MVYKIREDFKQEIGLSIPSEFMGWPSVARFVDT